MDQGRRTFLKGVGLAVSAGVLGPSAALTADLPASGGKAAASEMPRGMTFVTIRRGKEQSLGIKTGRGILDVRKAEATFKQKAPTTTDEVFQRGGGPALQRLADRAQNGKVNGLYLAEDTMEYGPCVTHPEKIICIGLNYRRHAAEVGQPVPKLPILFNKYNTALARHRGVIKVSQEAAEQFDYEVELVIVMGKVARDVSEADALSCVFGY